jgi:hypothetical protein
VPNDEPGERQWVIEPPPGPREVSLYVACGEGVELTPEQEAALGALLGALEARDPEVVGHADCSNLVCQPVATCNQLGCKEVRCVLDCHPLTAKAAVTAAGSSAWNMMGSFTL